MAGMAGAPGPTPPTEGGGEARPAWDNKLQYLLSCVGFAVGLGNLWRFPYLCQMYGGGAFLIPYVIALAFEGIPLFHIELAIGQRLRRGSIRVWTAISPSLGGVGLGCFTVSFLASLYYNMVLTWVLWYLLNSFQHPLPWSACPPDLNRTGLVQECQGSSPVSYFWYRRTLNVSADISDSGPVQWRLLLCLAASWAVVYLCVIRGIETTGKLSWGLSGHTARGSVLGTLGIVWTRRYQAWGPVCGPWVPIPLQMRVLQNPRVWLDAATQIFFSLSLAFGGHIAFASYNQPRNNCRRDAVSVALVNSMTSLYASIAVFSVLGFKAASDHGQCLDRNILRLINAFDLPEQSISRDDYAAALARLNVSQPARVAGLPLEACRLEDFLDKGGRAGHCVCTAPEGPRSSGRPRGPGRAGGALRLHGPRGCPLAGVPDTRGPLETPDGSCAGLVCLLCFLTSSCFTLRSGSYWLEIFDQYAVALNLILLAFFEVVGVVYVYGMKRLCDDIAWMTGRRPGFYWRVTWKVVSPLLLLTIFVAYVALLASSLPGYKAWNPQYEQFPSRQGKPYPSWVLAACALLSFLPTLWVPVVALGQLLARCREKTRNPPQDGGPKPRGSRAC
nr:sodium-dependent neutral amino acid transporter B(0)AT3 [Odocoileus virginianus texanus]